MGLWLIDQVVNSGNDGFGTFCRFAFDLSEAPNLEEKNTEKKFNEVRARVAIDYIHINGVPPKNMDATVDPL